MHVLVRRLTLDDTELFRKFRLAALRESPTSFAGALIDEEALSFAQWQTRLGAPGSTVLGYFLDGALVGTLGYFISAQDKRPWLWTTYVVPTCRRRGFGLALLARAAADLRGSGHRQVFLTVNSASAPARAMYEAFGFRQTQLQRNQPRVSGLTLDVAEMALSL